MTKTLLSLLLGEMPLAAIADDFSALEQQQISIATPQLFRGSDAFAVDFAGIKERDYSFPLPVGKATATKDHFVDITTSHGDAVKAMFDGTVRISRNHSTYGDVIVIRHDNGLETLYAHNNQNLVKTGDKVRAGQTIAIVGGIGSQTMCRFAIMVNGCRINPATVIGIRSHRLLQQTVTFRQRGTAVAITVTHPDHSDDRQIAWAYPLKGAKVISQYGRRGGRGHTGVDLKTFAGDDIVAAFDGEVIMSQVYSGYGNCIQIRHASGIVTLYSHNKTNLVHVGDKVKAGQTIATTGRTGRATTEHLHFECRVAGQPFDPGLIFDHKNHTIRPAQLAFAEGKGKFDLGRKLTAKK